MRISDWSSDVCSSDLLIGSYQIESLPIPFTAVATDVHRQREVWLQRGPLFDAIRASIAIPMVFTPYRVDGRELVDGGLLSPMPMAATRMYSADRSEEHTSELQSLMRISYAVFCLKKKKTNNTHIITNTYYYI